MLLVYIIALITDPLFVHAWRKYIVDKSYYLHIYEQENIITFVNFDACLCNTLFLGRKENEISGRNEWTETIVFC